MVKSFQFKHSFGLFLSVLHLVQQDLSETLVEHSKMQAVYGSYIPIILFFDNEENK